MLRAEPVRKPPTELEMRLLQLILLLYQEQSAHRGLTEIDAQLAQPAQRLKHVAAAPVHETASCTLRLKEPISSCAQLLLPAAVAPQ